METAPAQLQPDTSFSAGSEMKVALINLAAAALNRQRGEIMAEMAEEVHRVSTPGRDGHRLDEMWRIRAVIDTLHQIPKSRIAISRKISRGFP
jgi:hypothetical protein